jgi:hypothetical protein
MKLMLLAHAIPFVAALFLRLGYKFEPKWTARVLDISLVWIVLWSFSNWYRMFSGRQFSEMFHQRMLAIDMFASGLCVGMLVCALFFAGALKSSVPRFKRQSP